MSVRRVLGVDVCSKGWVAVATGLDVSEAYFGATIGDLMTVAQGGRRH
jgi:hypothetical protein